MKHVISENVEIVLDGQKYLLEKGDVISVIEGKKSIREPDELAQAQKQRAWQDPNKKRVEMASDRKSLYGSFGLWLNGWMKSKGILELESVDALKAFDAFLVIHPDFEDVIRDSEVIDFVIKVSKDPKFKTA